MLSKVYIVGAGPGDLDLLTVRAVNILKQADSILYDSLVNVEILKLAPPKCKKIFVGKRLGMHSITQDEINRDILSELKMKKMVVRLKGGDPLIFGRAGEEIDFLNQAGVAYEVVPGVTSACAVAAVLGVSITHRTWGQSAIFLSGYKKDTEKKNSLPDYDWNFLAREPLTIVFYMALYNFSKICKCLLEHGKPASTPIVVVSNCTLKTQKILSGTLDTIVGQVEQGEMEFPAMILIGNVLNSMNSRVE